MYHHQLFWCYLSPSFINYLRYESKCIRFEYPCSSRGWKTFPLTAVFHHHSHRHYCHHGCCQINGRISWCLFKLKACLTSFGSSSLPFQRLCYYVTIPEITAGPVKTILSSCKSIQRIDSFSYFAPLFII